MSPPAPEASVALVAIPLQTLVHNFLIPTQSTFADPSQAFLEQSQTDVVVAETSLLNLSPAWIWAGDLNLRPITSSSPPSAFPGSSLGSENTPPIAELYKPVRRDGRLGFTRQRDASALQNRKQ